MSGRPLVAWPGRDSLLESARLAVVVAALFGVVYGGADFAAMGRPRLRLFLPFELGVPLWAWTVLVYDSICLLFLLAPFVLRDRARLKALAGALCASILAAGAVFLVFPTEPGFPAPVVGGALGRILAVSDAVNLSYNMVPSLHVCLSLICLQAFADEAPALRAALFCWGGAIALSTLLTHQHHVLDVVTGAALARVMFILVYPRRRLGDR